MPCNYFYFPLITCVELVQVIMTTHVSTVDEDTKLLVVWNATNAAV